MTAVMEPSGSVITPTCSRRCLSGGGGSAGQTPPPIPPQHHLSVHVCWAATGVRRPRRLPAARPRPTLCLLKCKLCGGAGGRVGGQKVASPRERGPARPHAAVLVPAPLSPVGSASSLRCTGWIPDRTNKPQQETIQTNLITDALKKTADEKSAERVHFWRPDTRWRCAPAAAGRRRRDHELVSAA